jgi:hypothetical protein
VTLHVSDSADRSRSVPLSGTVLLRSRFVFVDAPGATGRDLSSSTTPLAGVTLTLRRAGAEATFTLTETVAPFDLRATDARGAAGPLATRALADGSWVVTASWSFKSGRCAGAARTATVSFTIDNSGPVDTDECALAAFVSTRPDRAGAVPLSDAVVRGKVYLFIAHVRGSTRDLYPASTVLSSAAFSLDAAGGTAGSAPYPGPPITRTERIAPFDFAGGTGDPGGVGDPLATAWDSSRFPAGEYTLYTGYTFVDESIAGCGDFNKANVATFTVAR